MFVRISIITLLALLLSVFGMSGSQANAQVTVEAMIDSTQMVVGEQTGLHLTATVKKGQQVVFRQWRPLEQLTPGVEVVEAPTVDTVDTNDGYIKVVQHLTLTSFEDSLYYIPAQKVKVDGKEYESKNLALKVLTIEVDTLKSDNFYGPNDVQDNPFQWEEWERIFTMGAVVMLLYVLCIIAFVRLKSNKPITLKVRIIKKILPHQRALNSIDRIKGEGSATDEKTYYTQLTDTLRKYIEERFGFNAMEMTSSEIIARLREGSDQDKIEELTMLFETADLVKFAKYTVGMSENDRNLVSAIDFINTTKQENLPTEERVEPVATEQEKQTMRMRLSLKWAIVIMTTIATALLVYVGWLLYDLRM